MKEERALRRHPQSMERVWKTPTGVVNSRPLTYVVNDTEGVFFPLTPNLLQEPSDRFAEVISTYETLSR